MNDLEFCDLKIGDRFGIKKNPGDIFWKKDNGNAITIEGYLIGFSGGCNVIRLVKEERIMHKKLIVFFDRKIW